MTRLALGSSIFVILCGLGVATVAGTPPANTPSMPAPNLPKDPGQVAPVAPPVAPSADPNACVHTAFKTQLVQQACAKGGQPEAKAAMKAFMKDKKIKSCNVCHSKLAPKYDLKPDGLDQFTKAGGK